MSRASKTAVSFRDCRTAVDCQIDAGRTFGQVEDFISACPLDEEHKAALWLWAWTRQSPETQHRMFAESDLFAESGVYGTVVYGSGHR